LRNVWLANDGQRTPEGEKRDVEVKKAPEAPLQQRTARNPPKAYILDPTRLMEVFERHDKVELSSNDSFCGLACRALRVIVEERAAEV
jgi:hypothetical protein